MNLIELPQGVRARKLTLPPTSMVKLNCLSWTSAGEFALVVQIMENQWAE